MSAIRPVFHKEIIVEQIKQAAELIKDADIIHVSAGAGMGVDSGMPDFRGHNGFWKAYPMFKEQGLSFHDVANGNWFRREPIKAWAFYGQHLNLYRNTEPHQGFSILKKWW